MKIVHINTHDLKGGAARAALRLHKEMLRSGIDSSMFVLKKDRIGDDTIKTVSMIEAKVWSQLRGLRNSFVNKKTNIGTFGFSNDAAGVNAVAYEAVRDADVIYLHWINSNFLSVKNIGKILKIGKPVVWVQHDMWPLTGGCHCSLECNRYISDRCRMCPAVPGSDGQSVVRKTFRRKEKHIGNAPNLTVVTPSHWLGDCVRKSPIFEDIPVKVIPNVLDRTIFKPLDKDLARDLFGIDRAAKVIMFAAEYGVGNPLKGWSYLKDALSIISAKGDKVEALIIGSDENKKLSSTLPFKTHYSGRLYDDYSLAMLYNAADAFVTPSLADNLPNTVLESLSCGTPVVAFDIGGIPDMVRHKENGYLAKYRDVEDLASGIEYVLGNIKEGKLSKEFDVPGIIELHGQLWAGNP